MQFGTVPVETAQGAILAHAVRVGPRLFKKGRVLSPDDVAALAQAGVEQVAVARLEADDVPEDEAAARLAVPCAGAVVRTGAAFTGRANLYAAAPGLAQVDLARVEAINGIDEAITLATVAPFTRVIPRQLLATVKIIPFAAPRSALEQALRHLAGGPAVTVAPFVSKRAALISTFLPSTNPAVLEKNRSAVDTRLTALGSEITFDRRVAHEPAALAGAIKDAHAASCDPILVFGASAITDRRDVVPAGLEHAGGVTLRFGMPVDPGNLLLLGALDGATVIGLPGCARSPKPNGFDYVLWRVLAGIPVAPADIAAMGVGGLLSEIPTRPRPRDERPVEPPRAPRIGAVILAAGLSTRMGTNKLLTDLGGKTMIRRVAEAASASHAEPVIVVTGHAASTVEGALEGLTVEFANNPDYSKGLSTSLKTGLRTLPEECDGAVILLGDMPDVDAALVDRMIAAFDPEDGRAICLATRHGKRGNPVLWARRFFPEMLAIEGDVGARNLIGAYDELACEIEAASDAPLTDIDTPEALAAYRART